MAGHSKHHNPPASNFGSKTVGIFLLLVLIFFGALEYKIFDARYKDRFYPGIYLGGESVGGQTYQEVLDRFQNKITALEKNGLEANFESSQGVEKINIPMSEIGFTADNSIEYFSVDDWENNLKKAYEWGHGPNPIRNLKEQAELLFIKKDFNFSAELQKFATDSFVEHTIYNFLKKSVPASFSFTGNKAVIKREVMGETIDRNEVLNTLEEKLVHLDITPANFVIKKDTPRVTKEKLEPYLDLAERFAKEENFVFQYGVFERKIKGSKFATWLTINQKNSIGVDRAKLETYLDSNIAKFIASSPQNSRFQMQGGELVETVSGKTGNAIDTTNILEKLEKIIADKNSGVIYNTIYIPIKVVRVEPKVTKETVEKYRIVDLVGAVRTSFNGSTADREHNIKIGAAAVNGIVISPGEEFSTVASIGHVSAQEGYVKEMVIKENKTTKEYGGGLCQIATTLFRLALNSGLPVTERQNHRFVVHYYDPPGLDATIYGPHPDFRFVNDTDSYLLLQARVEGKQVVMELYGQTDGRSVKISSPLVYDKIPAPPTKYIPSAETPLGQTKCTEAPHDGVTTDVLYSVKYPDGTIKEKNFHSVYQPWQKVCLVGTGESV